MKPEAREMLSEIVDALSRPLEFAAKDEYSGIAKVRGLFELSEALYNKATNEDIPAGKKLPPKIPPKLPPKAVTYLAEIKLLFKDFDALTDGLKKERLLRAFEVVDALRALGRGDIARGSKEAGVGGEIDTPPEPRNFKESLEKLSTPIQFLKGVGPKLAERFKERKGITTVEDLLYYLPKRYEDRSSLKKIRELQAGEGASTVGEVMVAGEVKYGRRKVFEVALSDGTGILKCKWFNYRLPYMKKFKPGSRFIFFGQVSAFGAQKEMIHPDVEAADKDEAGGSDSEGVLPIYSQLDNLHQKTIRKIMERVVEDYSGFALGVLTDTIRKKHSFLPLPNAFRDLHSPGKLSAEGSLPARARESLVFDEFFALEIGLLLKKRGIKKEEGIAFALEGKEALSLEARLRAMLPFKLTRAQERVLLEIKEDMALPHPMNRLVQGDVGSGKTIVSLIALLSAIGSGYQAALMAPTEILAEQHYLLASSYAEELGLRSVLLTGSQKSAEKKANLEAIASGEARLVFGTHALIQKGVEFKNLGLAVIDEQHRFGVMQRSLLKSKAKSVGSGGVTPDVLVMTATPIPRTLSMTVFGDLDVSTIDELPGGRSPIKTKLLRDSERQKAYSLVLDELKRGSQAYVVCPLVEESEELSLRDATNLKESLQKVEFRDYKVELLHGRMKSVEKERIMSEFRAGKINVLVTTTVIEVGVDVPNATVMVIEHAERFGLAQLHQLRGRVGRGEKDSYCILLAAFTPKEETYKRLKVIEETLDGFRIAEEDLLIRGPGDFLGTRQSGLPEFRAADLLTDVRLLTLARDEALGFLNIDPEMTSPEGKRIREVVKSRWRGRLELSEVG